MKVDDITELYDYTSMEYWDERYAADETVYEWYVLEYQSNV